MKKSRRIRYHRPERDRMLFKLLHRISELTPTEAARGTSVSPQTITNWRKPVKAGGTRYPQFATMDLVARKNGLKFVLTEDDTATQRAEAGVSHYAA
jgi:hypothetical protein